MLSSNKSAVRRSRSAFSGRSKGSQPWLSKAAVGAAAALAVSALSGRAMAASSTWTQTDIYGNNPPYTGTHNWIDAFDWNNGMPGALSGTSSSDVATFDRDGNIGGTAQLQILLPANATPGLPGIVIGGITFDLTSASSNNALDGYVIGGILGSSPIPNNDANGPIPLGLSDGGTILVAQNWLGQSGACETISAPVILEGNTAEFKSDFYNGNGLDFTGPITVNSAVSGSVLLTLDGEGASGSNSNIIYGNISNGALSTVGITKLDISNFTLAGANTYTGTTNVSGGSFTLDFSPTSIAPFAGSTFNSAGGTTSNIINPASPMIVGSVLRVVGQNVASTFDSQTFNSFTVNPGALLQICNASPTNNVVLNLGTIAVNPGGTVNFAEPTNNYPGTGNPASVIPVPSAGGLTATNGYTLSNANVNGILGGWATVANITGTGGANGTSSYDWATNSNSSGAGFVTPLASYNDSTNTLNSGWGAGLNTNANIGSANEVITAASTTNSLRFGDGVGNSSNSSVTLSGINVLSSGGILVSTGKGTYTSTITGGTLEAGADNTIYLHTFNNAGITTGNTNWEVTAGRNQSDGALIIASQIADNGSPTAVVKDGAQYNVTGTQIASLTPITYLTNKNNSYTGGTYLAGGVLDFASGALGTTGNLTFGGVTLTNQAAVEGSISGGTLQWAAGNVQDISGRIKNSNVAIGLDTNGNNVVFNTGLDASDTAGIVKQGAGSLTLTQPAAFTGHVAVYNGTLVLANNQAAGNATLPTANTSTNVLWLYSMTPTPTLPLFQTVDFAYNTDAAGNASLYNIFNDGTFGILSSDRSTPGAGVTYHLGTLSAGDGVNQSMIFTSGPNVTSGSPAISIANSIIPGGLVNGSWTFIPTTANLILGDIIGESVYSGSSTITSSLALGGLAQNNVINGVISDGPNGGRTVWSTSPPRTPGVWTLTNANTLGQATLGQTSAEQFNINAGTIILQNTNAIQYDRINLGNIFGMIPTLKLESNSPATFVTANDSGSPYAVGSSISTFQTGIIDVDPVTTGSAGTVITLNNLSGSQGTSGGWENFTSSNGYTLAVTTLRETGLALPIPTTANLAIGTFTNYTTSNNFNLGGTSTGNTVGSILAPNSTTVFETLVKFGPGTWTATGSAGAYTYTGATTIVGGTLKEDLSVQQTNQLPSAAVNNANNFQTALSLGGGAFSLLGSNSTPVSQSFAGTTTALSSASGVVVNANGGGSTVLNLGGIIRSVNVGGTIDFTLDTAAGQSATNGITTTSVNNLVNGVSPGILGGWATVSGSDWAVSGASTITGQTVSNASTGTNTVTGNLSNGTMISGAGFGGLNANFTYWVVNSTGTTFQIANSSGGSANPNLLTGLNITTAAYNIPGNITALASYTPLSGGAIPTGNPWANVVASTAGTIPLASSPNTINTLKYDNAGAATLDLATVAPAGSTLVLNSGGILIPAASGALTIGSTVATGGNITGGAGNEIMINNLSTTGGVVTVNSAVTMNNPATVSDLIATGGKVILNNLANTQTSTFVTGGATLNISDDRELGLAPASANNFVQLGGGTLQLGASFALNFNRRLDILSSGGTVDTNGFNLLISNQVQTQSTLGNLGYGNFTKTGAGTLTLASTAANGFIGRTYITGGTLNIAADVTLGTAPNPALMDSLNINNATLQFAQNMLVGGTGLFLPLSVNRGIQIGAGGATFDTQGFSDSVEGILQGPGSLTKIGSGTLYLENGQQANAGYSSFTGAVNILAGKVAVNNIFANDTGGIPQELGMGTSAITLGNAASPNNSAVLQYDSNGSNALPGSTTAVGIPNGQVGIQDLTAPVLDRPIVVAPGDTGTILNLSGANTPIILTGSGGSENFPLTLANSTISVGSGLTLAGGTNTYSKGSFEGTFIVNDSISGSGGGLSVNSQANVTLGSASNTYAGPTIVSGSSTLKNGIANATSPNSVLILGASDNSPGTYDLAGYSSTVAGLGSNGFNASSGVSNNGSANGNADAVLTVNSTVNTGFIGTISDGSLATTALTKTGSGSLTISGAATYSGATIVNGGMLKIANTTALPNTSSVSVGASGNFSFATGSGGNMTLAPAATLTLASGSRVGVELDSQIIDSTAASTAGTVTVDVYGQTTTPADGLHTLISAPSGLSGAAYVLGNVYNDTNFTLTGGVTSSATQVQVTTASATALTTAFWKGGFSGGNNVWAISDGSTASNFTATSGGPNQPLVPGSGAAVTFSGTGATNEASMVLGASMNINGLTINDNNTFGLNNDGNTLTVGSGNILVNSSAAVTINAPITGSALLTQSGPGTLTLGTANNYTGGTNISGGILNFVNGALGVTPAIAFTGTAPGGILQYSSVLPANTQDVSPYIANSTGPINIDTNGNNVRFGTALASNNSGGLTKNGLGTLTLAVANSYTGTTTINGGILNFVTNGLGATPSSIVFGGGTLQYSASVSIAGFIATPNTQDISAALTSSSSAMNIDTNGNVITYATALGAGNTGGLNKLGLGTLKLSAAGTYTGGTTISNGTLQVGATNALPATGAVTLGTATTNGTLDLNGNNQAVGSLAVGSGAIPSAQVIGSSSTAANSVLTVNTAGGSSSFAGTIQNTLLGVGNKTVALVVSGGNTLQLSGPNSYTGGTNVSNGTMQIGASNSLPTGGAVSFGSGATNGTLDLNGFRQQIAGLSVNGTTPASQLIGNSSTTADSVLTVDTTGASSTFTGVIQDTLPAGGNKTVALVKQGINTLTLSSANLYTGGTEINGGVLAFINGGLGSTGPISFGGAGGTLFYTTGNTQDVSARIAGSNMPISINTNNQTINYSSGMLSSNTGGLTKSGSGTLILSGVNSYSGTNTVSGGTLDLVGNGSYSPGTNLTISSGATVVAVKHVSPDPFNVLQVNVLNNAGLIDLSNNAMSVQSTTNVSSSALAVITAQVKTGFNGGLWTGTSGIKSSFSATDTTHLTALGVMQNNQSGTALYTAGNLFEGTIPAVNAILIKDTYYGDTDLNGKVDGTDYGRIDNAFLADQSNPTAFTGWFNGDFNYDGVINGSDYTLIDNAFNNQGAVIAAQFATPSAELSGGASGSSSVPEPTTLGLLGIGAVGLLGRRRHR